MKTLITRIKRLALALCFVTPLVSWAATMTNPVTGETETYVNTFLGTNSLEWNAAGNWDTGNVPYIQGGVYTSALIDGKTASSASASIDGWTLQVGAYNGATIQWNGGISKIQAGSAGAWLTADATSTITIASFGGNQLEGSDTYPLKLTSANAGGITWTAGITSSSNNSLPFWYYLKGAGTVVYGGDITVANAQVIKMADVTLSGTSQVASKTLVTFGSGTTKTFTADAAVKIKNGDDVLKTVYLTSVTAGATTLTAESDVGSCELVQTPTGIVLYYVDGNPADVNVEEKTYKPSISINFTNGASNGLTTQADVGLSGYEVPGTSWNNYEVANSTFSTVNAVDSTGAASAMSGVSVTISGTRGSYSCGNLTPSTNPLHGYIDENGDNPTPTVTVTGIPYYKYRVLVYHSTDSGSAPFGYDTINGTNYTYVNDALSEGTTAWGNAGAQDSANAIAEGGNVLVTEALSGSTLTVVGHRAGGNSSARGCIAAIQIIEVKADVGENDLEIPVSGDTQYTVEETKELSGTVYLTGLGTLTLAGENKISAATIEISEGVTLVVAADRLDATTFTGAGTVVYDGSQPDTTKGFDNSAWTGTVWVKNVGDTTKGEATDAKVTTCLGSNTTDATSNELNKWGNAASFVKFTNVRGYMAAANVPWTLILEDDSSNYAWYNNEGWTARTITIAGLKGDGTFWDVNDGGTRPFLNFTDASQFTGAIHATGKQVFLSGAGTGNASDLSSGRITVPANQTLTVASGKTWHTRNGLVVNGTLNVNGTLASDSTTAAVSGSGTGTVVFTGRVPTPTGNAWWKNASWTGAVQIAGVSNMTGDTSGTKIAFNDYGNEGSIVELNNVTGWLPSNFTCTPKLKVTGTLSLTNGSSGKNNAFKVGTLLGSGTISGSSSAPTAVFNVTSDWSGFTGGIGLNSSKCVVFGETIPDTLAAGTIYISEGAVAEIKTSGNWWATGGIVVDGTLKASGRGKWGGGTPMVINDTGILELTSTGSVDESNSADYNYGNVTGTGTIKFNGSGYRGFPYTSPADTLSIVAEQAQGIVFRQDNKVIGSLSGTKNLRSDLGGSNKTLTIKQAKDGVWSGIFKGGEDRLATIIVAPGESTTGTLTLAGTQDQNGWTDALTVSGSVNLTGTWKGDTTVSGTFGGTGTLTGDLTFAEGATLKVFASDADGLSVSGTVAYPDTGTVTVDVADDLAGEIVVLTASELDETKFALSADAPAGAVLAVTDGALKALKVSIPLPTVTITIPTVANTTVAVTVGGVAVTPENGVVTAQVGATVVVTYTADEGYTIANGTIEFTAAADTTTVDTTDVTVTEYIAWIYDENGDQVGDPYTTVLEAVQAFLAKNIGNSIRFKTSIESSEEGSFHQMLISVCSYDSETLTYTRLPVVANVTSGQFTVGYTSLASAVANVLDGSVVTLVANVTLDERVDVNPGENTTLTIDLGGYTITREGTSGNGSAFRVVSGTVTIKNGTIDCTQDDADIVANGVCAIDAGGKNVSGAAIVLEDLTVKVVSKNGSCVYPWVGNTITIKSGTYRNDTKEVYGYGRFKDAGLKGMAVNQGNTADQLLFIEGGTFSQVNPALGDDSWADGAGTFVADGYEATETSTGVWTVDVTDPTIGGETVEPAKVFDTATTAEGIVYPKAPTVSGEPGSQTITYKGTVVDVPAYYTATLSGTTVMLALNSNALPTIGATEASGDDEAVPATEVTDETFGLGLTTTSTKLYYGLATCDTPSGTFAEPTTLTQGTGKAMSLKANRGTNENVKFYKVFVTDIAPVAP